MHNRCLHSNGVRKIAPEENCPRPGSRFCLGLALELALGGNFPGGNFPRTHSNRCQVLCVFVLTYLKQFAKTDTRHKNLSIALNKNMPLESF